jgi:hypothetical protein
MAPITEIKTVLSVKVIASKGAAAISTPSARLERMLPAHKRLKAGPMSATLTHQIKEMVQLLKLRAAF